VSDATDYLRHREHWDRAWSSMPHRRLRSPPKISLGGGSLSELGDPVSATIAQDPPQFCDRAWRESEVFPICGEKTYCAERLAAGLYPRWACGLSLGFGVWVHHTCFERCPDSSEPTPIPW
jgi:hypothetical protein